MDPRLVRQILIGLYLAVGLYASIWLSDDFDEVRLTLLSFVGFPLAAAYYYIMTTYPMYRLRYRKIYLWHLTAMAVAFLYGHLLLLNALTGSGDQVRRNLTVEDKKRVLSVGTHRGGLGHLYTRRW